MTEHTIINKNAATINKICSTGGLHQKPNPTPNLCKEKCKREVKNHINEELHIFLFFESVYRCVDDGFEVHKFPRRSEFNISHKKYAHYL